VKSKAIQNPESRIQQPENKIIKVGLAEVKTAQKPHMLATPSVGSCVVVTLYDELKGIGSLAHRPESQEEQICSQL